MSQLLDTNTNSFLEAKIVPEQEKNGLEISRLKRRSRMETYCDILSVIAMGATKPTHILYRANLSWVVLSKCLDSLMALEIITREMNENGKIQYRLTNKGFDLLKQYLEIKDSVYPEE